MFEATADVSMDDLWDHLTRDERWVVFASRTYGVKNATAREVGKNPKWVGYHLSRRVAFRAAIESREWSLGEMQERIRVQLSAEGHARLIESLMTGVEIPRFSFVPSKSLYSRESGGGSRPRLTGRATVSSRA